MAGPFDIGVIDAMIGFPFVDRDAAYADLAPALKDPDTAGLEMPAGYMFKGVPQESRDDDPIATTIGLMDRWGVAAGLFTLREVATTAAELHPGRVHLRLEVNPNRVMETVAEIRRAHAEHDIKAVAVFGAGLVPQVPIDDPKMYPVYATCVELDIAAIVNAGVPGPRVPGDCQHVERIDPVCYDFPDLRLVMRHGAEPWEDLAVKLMVKWPNLHYMTSAFAPKHYPRAIIDYANTRGADRIIYAGYYPSGLTLERIFTELPEVAFRDHVWPRFLRENAERVFGL